MLPEKVEQRRIVKLHPRLEGKQILFVESHALWFVMNDRFKLERISLLEYERMTSSENEQGEPTSVIGMLEKQHFEGVIIHPNYADVSASIKEISDIWQSGKPVIVLHGGIGVSKEVEDMHDTFRKRGIPVIDKLSYPLSEVLLDKLDVQFSAPRR